MQATCPKCAELLEVDDRHEGQFISCGACGEVFQANTAYFELVPASRPTSSSFSSIADDAEELAPRRRRHEKAAISGFTIFVGIAVLLIGGFIAAFLVYQDRRNENRIERQKLGKEIDQLRFFISDLEMSLERSHEEKDPELKINVADIRVNIRRRKAELSQLIKKFDSLWP
ncbi:MAG: hypothetical protein FJ271_19805 [Planctomycetes bacterium]|nr:hypothetical protein [Planctomycetota bacterium]